jgi:hypothetical protein
LANYLIPGIAAAATLGASIVSGFGAAALKHKWDIEDNERRWERERAERRREELKAGFSAYLTARSEMEQTMFLTQVGESSNERVSAIVSRFPKSFSQLRTLVDAESAMEIQLDAGAVSKWAEAMMVRSKKRMGEVPELTSDEPVRQLAHRLIDP